MNVLRPCRARFVIALLLPVLALLAAAPAAAHSEYYTLTPCEVYDSRDIGAGNKIPEGTYNVPVAGVPCKVSVTPNVTVTVPADAESVVVNVTVAFSTSRGRLAVRPAGVGMPLQWIDFENDKNRALTLPIVLGASGDLEVQVELDEPGAVFHLIVFVQGYFLPRPALDLDTDNSGGARPNFAAGFVEDAGPVRITDDVTVTDRDDAQLDHVTVTLTNRPDGAAEVLAADVGATGIVASYTSATGVLLLQGPASKADFETVLETVTYDNSAPTPDAAARVVTFVGNDGVGDGPAVTATVTPSAANDRPTITAIGDVTVDEDTETADIPFTVDDGETPAASLIVTAISSDQAIVPNANITLGGSGASRTVKVTPAANANGTVTISVTVDDGSALPNATVTETFDVTFTPVNDAPTVTSVADQAIAEDGSTGPLGFTIGDLETAVGSLTVTAASSDQALIPDANVVLGGVNPNRTVTVTPVANQSGGPVTITISVSDGTNTTTETFTVTVGASNDAPTVTSIDDQTIDEDTSTGPLAFTVGDIDTAVASLTVTATSSDQALIPDANVVLGGVNPNRTVTVTPAANQSGGPVTITISVGDGTNTTTETFTVTVSAVNDTPTVTNIGDQVINEDTSTGPLAFTAGDVDTAVGSLTVTATSSDQALIPDANVVLGGVNPNRTVTVTPSANQSGGPVTITVSVSDGTNTATETFTVTVSAVNDPPTISDVGNVTIDEDTSTGPLAVTVGDIDTAVGSLTLTGASSDQTLIPNANIVVGGSGASRTVTVTPAPNQFGGPVTITLTVSDGSGSAVDTFTITINAVNDLPTVTAIGDQVIDEDTSTAPLAFTIGDVETPVASLTVTATSSDTTLIPNANVVIGGAGASRTVTVTPAPNQFGGPVTITISVGDGTNTTIETFTVTVNSVNDLPTITAIGDQVIDEDTSTNSLAFTIGDIETAAASLTVTGTSSNVTIIPNAGIVISGTGASRSVVVTPALNQFGGPVTITISVSDGTNTTPETFSVTVNAVNDAPTVTSIGNQTIDEDTSTGALAFTIGDIETAAGSLVVTGASSNTTLIPSANVVIGGTGASRTVTVTPAPNQFGGPATITITVNDGSGQPNSIVTTTFTVTVNSIPDPPVAGTDNFETFGNTELRVDLGTGTTPHIPVDLTGAPGVMNNDSDPVEGTPVSFTGVVGCADVTGPVYGDSPACATASGGQVVVQADGSFSYFPPQANPAVLATDSTDSFQYTIVDGEGATATGLVNLTRREVIWYIDSTAAAGGDGRSHSPFQNFAALNGVGGAGDFDNADDYIAVHDGTFNGSVELEAGQRLIGQGVAFSLTLGSLGSKDILPATTHPQINNASGDVIRVTSAVPARVAGLSLSGSVNAIDMPATGAYTGSGTLTIENNIFRGAGAEGIDINAGATGTLALNVQNNAWSAGTHTGNAIDVVTTNGALQLNISNNSSVLSTGASGIVAGASAPGVLTITGLTGNTVHQSTAGTGISINAALFDATPGGAVNRVYGGNTRIGTSGDGVGGAGLALTNVTGDLAFGDEVTVGDLDVFSAGTALTATSSVVGGFPQFRLTLTPPAGGGSSTLIATAGAALDIDSVTADLRLSALTSTGGLKGVSLLRLLPGSPAATFPARFHAPSGSSITTSNAAATAFRVDQSNAAIAYAGTINSTAGRGVDLTTNTGSTIDFSGTLTFSTGANPAFTATGGGAVTATDTASTLATTTATALNVASTTIGAGGLKFRSISAGTAASGPTNGIVLNSTGSSGGLTVSGSGAAGSGGTIQRATGPGVSLASTASVGLSWMNIQNGTDDGINGSNVTGFSLANSTLSGNGDALGDNGIDFSGLFGSASLTNSVITGSHNNNAVIRNSTGTLTMLTVSGGTFSNNASASDGDGLLFEASGTANMSINVSGTAFSAHHSDHFQAAALNSGVLNVVFSGNTLSGGHPAPLGQGITINAATGAPGFSGSVTYDVAGNTISGAISNAIMANLGTSAAAASFKGQIRNNVIGSTGAALSCSTQANGINVEAHGNGTHTVAVTGNTIRRCFDRGINVLANDGNGVLNLTATNNLVTEMSDTNGVTGTPREAFILQAGSTSTNVFGVVDGHGVCLSLSGPSGNLIGGAFKNGDIRLRQRFRSSVRLPGYGGAPFDATAVVSFVQGNNPGSAATATASDDAAVTTDGYFGGAACPLP